MSETNGYVPPDVDAQPAAEATPAPKPESAEIRNNNETGRIETARAAKSLSRRVWNDIPRDKEGRVSEPPKNKAEMSIGLLGEILSLGPSDTAEDVGADPVMRFEGGDDKSEMLGANEPRLRYRIDTNGKIVASVDKRISADEVQPSSMQKGEVEITSLHGKSKDGKYHCTTIDGDGKKDVVTLDEDEFAEIFLASQGRSISEGFNADTQISGGEMRSGTLGSPEARAFWKNVANEAQIFYRESDPQNGKYVEKSITEMAATSMPQEAKGAITDSGITKESAIKFATSMSAMLDKKIRDASDADKPKYQDRRARIEALAAKISASDTPEAGDIVDIMKAANEEEIRAKLDTARTSRDVIRQKADAETDPKKKEALELAYTARDNQFDQLNILLNTAGGEGSIYTRTLASIQSGESVAGQSMLKDFGSFLDNATDASPIIEKLEEIVAKENETRSKNKMSEEDKKKINQFIEYLKEHKGDLLLIFLMTTGEVIKNLSKASSST